MANEFILYSLEKKKCNLCVCVCDLSKQILNKCTADLSVPSSLMGSFYFPNDWNQWNICQIIVA